MKEACAVLGSSVPQDALAYLADREAFSSGISEEAVLKHPLQGDPLRPR